MGEEQDAFALFRAWLVKEDRASPATALVYASNVRRVWPLVGGHCTTQEGANQAWAQLKREAPTRWVRSRAAWGHFVVFAGTRDLTLFKSVGAAKRRRSGEVELPRELLRVIREIAQAKLVKVGQWPALTWAQAKQVGADWHVPDPTDSRVSLVFKDSWVQALASYSQGQAGEDRPMLPREPGSAEPLSSRTLRRALKRSPSA
jgi:hypothetical protein